MRALSGSLIPGGRTVPLGRRLVRFNGGLCERGRDLIEGAIGSEVDAVLVRTMGGGRIIDAGILFKRPLCQADSIELGQPPVIGVGQIKLRHTTRQYMCPQSVA